MIILNYASEYEVRPCGILAPLWNSHDLEPNLRYFQWSTAKHQECIKEQYLCCSPCNVRAFHKMWRWFSYLNVYSNITSISAEIMIFIYFINPFPFSSFMFLGCSLKVSLKVSGETPINFSSIKTGLIYSFKSSLKQQ